MAAVQSGIAFDRIAAKWQVLAQRRLDHIRELERSGRWKRYFTPDQLAARLREAEHAAMRWAALARQQSVNAHRKDDFRPAA